uniref:protein-serine/threonine phosphatase n=1 Tax=Haptolina ericina TaxID=156174 RepID=A0A7S3BWC3_9EUKA
MSLMSPRSNLTRLLERTLGGSSETLQAEHSAATDLLVQADAENKLRHKKMYLVLDLDETLVYTRRMQPGDALKGHKIVVQGKAFDVVLRPGLLQFLKVATNHFIVYMYTMGDEEYTNAVLAIIDVERRLFTGGILCWRPSESRLLKDLSRVVCDKRMALIVDDTIDVWQDDLANLFLIRRFVGDASDDGLQRLSWQLQHVHQAYFARVGKFSLDDAVYEPPDVREVLQSIRGSLLQGCHLALTGVVPDQSEDTLDQQPLCVLLKLYGAQLTLDITEATHLVARKKDGWTKSTKIRRALQRCQEDAKLHAVWDHWLLDSIVTWELQPERVYAIPDPSVDEAADAPSSSLAAVNSAFVSEGLGGRLSEIIGGQGALGVLPTRKRARDPALAEQQVPSKESVATKARMSVAQYLKQKETGVVGMAPRDCAGNANEVSMLDQDDSVSGED